MKYIFALIAFSGILFLAACSDSNEKENQETTESTKSNKNSESKTSKTRYSSDGNTDSESIQSKSNSKNQQTQNSSNENQGSSENLSDNSKMAKDSGEGNNSESQNKNSSNAVDRFNETSANDEAPSFNIHEYKKLNAFLGKYVSNGHVNYASIKSNKSELMAIINEFESTSPSSSWSKNEKLCFWINAYNIFTIKLIVDNYPTTSITKITAKPWDKKFIEIDGSTYSLNGIETDIIRKKYDEPRIHFALNCASKSCPILLNKAYKPGTLNSQLTSQTKAFLNDTSKNDFSSKKSIEISSIFDWYKDDFNSSGGVVSFINKYKGTDYDSPKISYMDYSWDLNK